MKNEKKEKLSQEEILAKAANDEKTLNAEIAAEEKEAADKEAADAEAADKEAADAEDAEQASAKESSDEKAKTNAKANKNKKTYEVLVSVMGGKGKKIFKHKDKVTAEELNGDPKDLITAGFIK